VRDMKTGGELQIPRSHLLRHMPDLMSDGI
jgi:hypothetical protein